MIDQLLTRDKGSLKKVPSILKTVNSNNTINGSISLNYLTHLEKVLSYKGVKDEYVLGFNSKFKMLSHFEQFLNSRLSIYLKENHLTLIDIKKDISEFNRLLRLNEPFLPQNKPVFLEIYSGLKIYYNHLECIHIGIEDLLFIPTYPVKLYDNIDLTNNHIIKAITDQRSRPLLNFGEILNKYSMVFS